MSTYIQEVYDSLQHGGSLIVDVRKGTDGIATIEKVFADTPKIIYEEGKFVRVAIKKLD